MIHTEERQNHGTSFGFDHRIIHELCTNREVTYFDLIQSRDVTLLCISEGTQCFGSRSLVSLGLAPGTPIISSSFFVVTHGSLVVVARIRVQPCLNCMMGHGNHQRNMDEAESSILLNTSCCTVFRNVQEAPIKPFLTCAVF